MNLGQGLSYAINYCSSFGLLARTESLLSTCRKAAFRSPELRLLGSGLYLKASSRSRSSQDLDLCFLL